MRGKRRNKRNRKKRQVKWRLNKASLESSSHERSVVSGDFLVLNHGQPPSVLTAKEQKHQQMMERRVYRQEARKARSLARKLARSKPVCIESKPEYQAVSKPIPVPVPVSVSDDSCVVETRTRANSVSVCESDPEVSDTDWELWPIDDIMSSESDTSDEAETGVTTSFINPWRWFS